MKSNKNSMLAASSIAILALALASCASARPYASPVHVGADVDAIMEV